MVILNPLEPWPGELVLEAAARNDVRVITRVVDYGGLFWGDLRPRHADGRARPPPVPPGRLDRAPGREKLERLRPLGERAGPQPDPARLRLEPLAPGRRLRAPTLIQEAGAGRDLDRGEARRARRARPPTPARPEPRSSRSARSATTPARCASRAPAPTTRAATPPTAGRLSDDLVDAGAALRDRPRAGPRAGVS